MIHTEGKKAMRGRKTIEKQKSRTGDDETDEAIKRAERMIRSIDKLKAEYSLLRKQGMIPSIPFFEGARKQKRKS